MTTTEPVDLCGCACKNSAYNQRDIEAFCACFSDDVCVLVAEGTFLHDGKDATFVGTKMGTKKRARYWCAIHA
jgi:hypothetical protein